MQYAPYRLKERRGALLKITQPDGAVGYADCHPWSERGDLPLEEQLNCLKRGKVTPLLRQSLHFAALDASARRKGVSLFENLKLPKTYVLAKIDQLPPASVRIKVKGGVTKEEIAILKNWGGRIRLDWNLRLERRKAQKALENLGELPIDYIEDPYPYDKQAWEEDEKRFGIPLARDVGSDEGGATYLIHKPAVQNAARWPEKTIITSYLDHPIGQLAALYTAAKFSQEYCGVASHLVYPRNAFSEQLKLEGEKLVPPEGTGWGFDELLDEQCWEG